MSAQLKPLRNIGGVEIILDIIAQLYLEYPPAVSLWHSGFVQLPNARPNPPQGLPWSKLFDSKQGQQPYLLL